MQFVQNNWILVFVAVASGALLLWPMVQKMRSGAQEVGTLAATRLINQSNAVLVDLREAKEYEGGKLPNALHIPMSQLKDRGKELAKMTKRPVVAYGARGTSHSATSVLKSLGFTEIYQLQGGLEAWKKAGLPLESTS